LIRDWFTQKKNYATIPSPNAKHDIPEGLVHKCPSCGHIHFAYEWEENANVCGACGFHRSVDAMWRLRLIVDEQTFVEDDAHMCSGDPLGFPGYAAKLEAQREKTGMQEALISGCARIAGIEVGVAVLSFDFFSGSMGSVVGEKMTRAIERATQRRTPIVFFCASGGARMQESVFSLMQMAKTAAALERHHRERLLSISVLTNPTLGGVTASFAMLGDIILAEPKAIVGFAGRIVIKQTIREQLPDDFQTAESNFAHGQIDAVVPRGQLRATIGRLLQLHARTDVGTEEETRRAL
jgi:acetyl-CoA carboxylase carboxyl transferase subunit beta